jgi:hypothetical protein
MYPAVTSILFLYFVFVTADSWAAALQILEVCVEELRHKINYKVLLDRFVSHMFGRYKNTAGRKSAMKTKVGRLGS